jgi:hypothetical protein
MMRSYVALAIIFFVLAGGIAFGAEAGKEKWPGVDDAVVNKFAKDAGREASEPLFGMEGDMLLFAFLVAGAVGGFTGGYYFRGLFPPRKKREKGEKDV